MLSIFRLPAPDSDSDTDEIDAGRTLRDVIDNELQRVPTLSVELDPNDTSVDSQRAIIALKNCKETFKGSIGEFLFCSSVTPSLADNTSKVPASTVESRCTRSWLR